MSTLISYNPLNQEAVGEVAITSPAELNRQLEASKKAQRVWANLSLQERGECLQRAYQELELQQEALARLISLEMGKDFRRASYEAQGTIHSAAYLVEEVAAALKPETVARNSVIEYRPLGVVAVISPWNYPLAMANNLIIPALMAGNSVLLKPSEHTPLVADLFVATLQEHLPENLLQVVHGDGKVGEALVAADINMVAFTGSLATGRHIMAQAAPNLKRLIMELGGNDPMIVMAGADIQAAAQFAVASSFENAGQMCTSTERIYVDEKIADMFSRQVVALAKQYRTGPWNQAGVNIGPLANPQQHQKVVAQLKDAEQKGGQFLLGQAQYEGPYIQPTVVSGITPDMDLEQQETFGPVVAMATFSSIDEAIERANDSVYGLGAVVFGGQDAKAVAQQLEAGMVSVNQGVGGMGDSPWVGAKQSGIGFHGSPAGHRQFAQVRVMNA